MDRQPVTSSNLLSVGYDAGAETLEVEFHKTGVYQYYNVPQFMHERLMAADSIGTFFNANIKNSYACSKM